ncbi:VCBS repeat-containing protein [Streptomyces sp. ID03-2B]|uniref:FG-GAP repeat domain-containing protein n=1 Tax=Streptomyces TaxID=1883 RepID=UPI0029BB832F|nr:MULTISPECIES: VCBS repeat-containing protein [unclassified Streptomyces]MDX3338097.1 VCBS repeat-containing protein [Streptomyces sp. ME02-6979.5a]MDX3591003.1 VCBS repeat-containing protein [Streptomyces sp. ID03-2B]
MRRITTIGIALVPTLTLTLGFVGAGVTAAAGQGAPVAVAAERPWGTPTALTDASGANTGAGVKVTSDGTAVTVWTSGTGDDPQELWGATRKAGATAWSAPVRIAAGQQRISGVYLVTGRDGSATVAWDRFTTERFDSHSTSTLLPGAGAWTAPAPITSALFGYDLMLVSGPGGRLTAVWNGNPTPGEDESDVGVFTSDLAEPGAGWSDAVQIGRGSAYELRAAAAGDGAVTVAWQADISGPEALRVSTRTAGSADWSAPEVIKSGGSNPGELDVQASDDGAALVSWQGGASARSFVHRPAGSTTWGRTEYLPADEGRNSSVPPQLERDGRVTAFWEFEGTQFRTATRTVDGTWSPTRTVVRQSDAFRFWVPDVGRDGSLAVMWTTYEGDLWALVRSDGAWPKPLYVGRADLYTVGTVAAGPDGSAVAVWNKRLGTTSDHYPIEQVWATVTGAAKPAHRDHVGDDGFPDLYARGTNGSLRVYQGDAAGKLPNTADGGTWPTTSTLIPFGDLDGDGANDTLVTNSAGDLFRHSPQRGHVVTPQGPATRIGSGWKSFDGLTGSGDFTADGRPDLVARETSTGDLYLYAGTVTGGLTRTGRIGTGWKNLTIVGAGDLNGDQHADLVARTAAGDLYRYDGTGRGTIGNGVKIGTGWGGMADIVGIGDLTGDGTDDILGRTTGGDLYRYAGNGTGGIGAGVKIGTGWKSFAGIR